MEKHAQKAHANETKARRKRDRSVYFCGRSDGCCTLHIDNCQVLHTNLLTNFPRIYYVYVYIILYVYVINHWSIAEKRFIGRICVQ